MSQARVTDFFVRSKKGGIDRALQAKGVHKVAVQTEASIVNVKENARTTRSNSKTTVRSTRSTKSIQTEPETAPENVDVSATVNALGIIESVTPEKSLEQTIVRSPRTPKRSSAEAEFDLGSTVFPNAAGLSSLKKRARVEGDQKTGVNAVSKTSEANAKKTARKKLILSKDESAEQAALRSSSPLPGDKEVKNLVNRSNNSSPVGKLQVRPQPSLLGSKPISKDVAALKSRLQKIQEKGKRAPLAPSTSVPGSSTMQATLARARELGARAQRRKEKLTEDAKTTVEERQPETDQGEKVPAYQRYHTLAQDVPPGLSLPYKFKVLAEMFRSMDTIVGMLFNRSETVTFAKVKQGVQDMMHKRFEEDHVGQIKTVYPSAYVFRQENNIPTFTGTLKKSSYQLTMEPVVGESNGSQAQLSASCLLDRRRTFRRNLVDIVKQHHKAFLASLSPPISVPDDKLTRWHPRFNVDEVPSVTPSELPQPPQTDVLTTAQEVLDKARSLMTPKMEKALANLALKTAEMACVGELEPAASTPAPPETPSALKGVSQSLLERIRAKEAQKLQAVMTRNPEQEERLLMMSRLGELARILRNVFVADKKPALLMEAVCKRMMASFRSALSSAEMERHLRLLAELTPEWLTVHPIRKDFYLKLNKTVDLNVVLEKLGQKIREEKC